MLAQIKSFSISKRGLLLMLVALGMTLSSCNEESVSPKDSPNAPQIFGDDPPKDTDPPKGGGGNGG